MTSGGSSFPENQFTKFRAV